MEWEKVFQQLPWGFMCPILTTTLSPFSRGGGAAKPSTKQTETRHRRGSQLMGCLRGWGTNKCCWLFLSTPDHSLHHPCFCHGVLCWGVGGPAAGGSGSEGPLWRRTGAAAPTVLGRSQGRCPTLPSPPHPPPRGFFLNPGPAGIHPRYPANPLGVGAKNGGQKNN